MPVRLPDVPGLSPTRINAPTPSIQAATAPARGLGELAQGIASISQPFAQISGQIQQAENSRQLSEVRTQLDTARTEHLIALESIQDPAAHLRLTDEFLQKSREIADRPDFSPVVRDRLTPYFDGWATDTRNRVAANAANLGQRRAMLATQNEIEAATQAGDEGRLNQALTDNPFILPEQADKIRTDFATQQQELATQQTIAEDPLGWLEENPAPDDPNAYGQWSAYNRQARAQARAQTAQVAENFDDLLASDRITSPEQIDELYGDQRPAVLETMKAALARKNDAALDLQRKSEPYQNELAGMISERIKLYDPTGETFDADYVDISTRIAELNPGPLRTEYGKQLDALRDGRVKEIKTKSDAAFKQLDEAFEAQKFGAWMSGQSTASAIDAGLITDTAKLTAAGFTEDQIDELTDSDLSRTERTALFRQLFDKRTGESTLDPYSTAAMQAIMAGDSSFDYLDQTRHDTARSAHGKARKQLAEFLTINPQATEEQISAKLQSIGIETEADDLRSQFFPGIGVLPPMNGEIPTESEIGIPPP